MPFYDDPQYTVIREKHITGAISCAGGVPTAFVGTTMRSSVKAVITGVAFRIGSGGSAAGTNSISVARIGAGGVSTWQVLTVNVSAGASGASAGRNCFDISLVSALTMASLGEGAVLVGQAASLDKVAVLSDVVWRYRLLPIGDSELTNATLG